MESCLRQLGNNPENVNEIFKNLQKAIDEYMGYHDELKRISDNSFSESELIKEVFLELSTVDKNIWQHMLASGVTLINNLSKTNFSNFSNYIFLSIESLNELKTFLKTGQATEGAKHIVSTEENSETSNSSISKGEGDLDDDLF